MTWPAQTQQYNAQPQQNQQPSGNLNHLLKPKATKSASFKGQFPVRWEGFVEDAVKNPAYEYDPSKPNNRGAQKFWDDGNPVENLWITLLTDVRDPQIDGDDGRRVLVLDSKNKADAVIQAVQESGADFEKGGHLTIEWYGYDPAGKNPDNLPKLYRARYQGPSLNAALGVQQAPAPAQQGGWAQAAAHPSPAAPAANTASAGWGAPQVPAAPAQAPYTPPSAPAPAVQAGWGAPAPQAPPVQPDPVTYDEFVAAFRRKGVDPSTITSAEQAAQVWAYVKNNPDVA